MGPTDSVQALPADDDIQGLYNLEVPQNWDQTEDPVVYGKYFRAELSDVLGTIPEVILPPIWNSRDAKGQL